MLPGSKGIALSAEQFRILKNAASDVTAALSSQDTDFKVSLSSKYGHSLWLFFGLIPKLCST